MRDVFCRNCFNLTCGRCGKVMDSPDPDLKRDCQFYTDTSDWGIPFSRVRELVEADKEGRVTIAPKLTGETCGTCGNFCRITGTRRGTCKVKPFCVGRRGYVYEGVTFLASQSRKACKKYVKGDEA